MTTLMLADPDLPTRKLLGALAERSGRWPSVVEVSSTQDAIACLRRRHIDLIVTELRFRDGNATTLLEAVRTLPAPNPLVVVFTADVLGAATHERRLVRLGASDVIVKPAPLADLVRVLSLDLPLIKGPPFGAEP